MDALPTDASLALLGADQNDLVRRKLEMDALRNRLGDTRTERKKLREACEGFESIFIQKLWEQMRKTVPKEGYLHSKDEETYQSLFDVELAKKMASAGGIGLADMLYGQLSQQLDRTARATASGARGNLQELMRPAAAGRPRGQGTPEKTTLTEKDLYSPLTGGENSSGEEDVLDLALTEIRADLEELERSSAKGAAIRAEIAAGPSFAAERPEDRQAGKVSAPVARASGLRGSTWQGTPLVSAKPKPASSLGRRDGPAEAKAAPETAARERYQGLKPPEILWPYDGKVVSPFGWTEDPGGGRRWNSGITLDGVPGESVRAVQDGTVVFSGRREGCQTLVLEHRDGLLSYYGNVEAGDLQIGDPVALGTEFAKIQAQSPASGKEENSAPLFFALKRGEMALNPETAIKRLPPADRE
ncbi:MAG: rod-binding protein [Desulfovibrio sp.]|jgi:Rod binding domain-containing protein|nr:rod-binding protein [Desulfovibrio sp.]